MNFFKRAMISIKRKPGKAVILMMLVFILGNLISGAISIQQAVENTENNLRSQLAPVATIQLNRAAMDEHEKSTGEWPNVGRVTPEIIQKIGNLSYVSHFDYSVATELFSSELDRVTDPDRDDWNIIGLPGVEGLTRFRLMGVHNPNIVDIQEGVIELVAGRPFTEQEVNHFNNVSSVAIVSRSFTEINNLTVGSTFMLDNTIYDYRDLDEGGTFDEIYTEENVFTRESYEFKVVGIFEPRVEINTGLDEQDREQMLHLENIIYVPNAVTERAIAFQFEQQVEMELEWMQDVELEDMLSLNPTFILYDSRELGNFADEANELLPDFWIISDLSNTFAEIASSMETMQMLARMVLWAAVGATLIILSLLITLFLRDRKHEIGIYLALGEKKSKVITQIMLEVASVSIVAVTLSLFSGSLIASNLSENMLRQDLIARQENEGWEGTFIDIGGTLSLFSDGDMTIEEMMESYDLTLDATTIMMFCGVGIGAILVSTIVPVAYMMRFDPRKIMM